MLTGMGWEGLGAPALQPSSTHSLASHHSSAPGTKQPLPYHKPGKVIPPKRGGQRVSSSAMSSVSFTKHPQPLRQGSSGLCSAGLGAAGCLGSALAPAGWEQTPPCKPLVGLRQPYAGKEQPARVYWHPLHISFLSPSFLGKFLQGEAV